MSNYRLLQNGVLGSLTACPTCPQSITVLYNNSSLNTACCVTGGGGSAPYTITVWIAAGETFFTAAQFYTNESLSQTVSNGWYSTVGQVGGRYYRQKISQTGSNNFTSATLCPSCP